MRWAYVNSGLWHDGDLRRTSSHGLVDPVVKHPGHGLTLRKLAPTRHVGSQLTEVVAAGPSHLEAASQSGRGRVSCDPVSDLMLKGLRK